jgi:2,5-diketo-D-gluconate reductase A
VTPEVNQIERHPYLIRSASVAFNSEHGIITEGWSPLGRGNGLLDHPVVTGIAEQVNRTPSQVLLRWAVQEGHAVAVKSKSRERQAENLQIFDFSLTAAQMADLDDLDTGEHHAVDSDVFGH